MTVAPASDSSPLRILEAPPRLHVPVGHHAGQPPEVLAGRYVAKGQMLTGDTPDGAAAVLAPTSGRVVGTGRVTLTNAREVHAIEVEPDFEDRAPPEPHSPADAGAHRERLAQLHKAAPEQLGLWIDRLRAAGVWADRISSPDLLAQLHGVLRRPIDTVVCNVLDHDPLLRLGSAAASRSGALLITATGLLARLTSARNIFIAVDAGAPSRWWMSLRRELRHEGIEIANLVADYPRGHPTMLLHAMLGRRLRPGRLPIEQGVLLFDAVAAAAVGRAAVRSQPMLRTTIAVRDHIQKRFEIMAVMIGTPVRHVLAAMDIIADDVLILAADLLRDQPVNPDAVISGGEIALHVVPKQHPIVPDPCIRCGWCAIACPTRVQPAAVLEAAQCCDSELALRNGIAACIECGICSFICPSRLPLLDGIRTLRAKSKSPSTP